MPTKYTDFLLFAAYIIVKACGWDEVNCICARDINRPYDRDVVLRIIKNSKNESVSRLIERTLDIVESELNSTSFKNNWVKNDWLRYFLYVYASKINLRVRDNWVDLEAEIKDCINYISETGISDDQLRNGYEKYIDNATNVIPMKFFFYNVENEENDLANNISSIAVGINSLYMQLKEFEKLLAFYLNLVDSIYSIPASEKVFKNIGKCVDGQGEVSLSKILSFNYTRNAERYLTRDKVEWCHYINGSLKGGIILGYDNIQDDLDVVNDNRYRFLKNVQRIEYDINQDYRSWFLREDVSYTGIEILIIGHSLDETDKNILMDIFDSANRVIITYHKQEDRVEKIRKLYRLLGDKRFHECVNNPWGKPDIRLVSTSAFM